jgi:hypothetical protein
MKKRLSLSLNLIKRLWSGTGTKLSNADFCLSVLPDYYHSKKCENHGQYTFDTELGCSKSTLDAIMRGRRSADDPRHPAVGFAREFLRLVKSNAEIQYLDPKKYIPGEKPVLFRNNMLDKIRQRIRTLAAPKTKHHPLFGEDNFLVGDDCDEDVVEAYHNLHQAIALLTEQETEATFTYAIFLLLVAAIAQQMLPQAGELYSPAAVQQVIKSDGGPALIETFAEKHIPFTDPHYLHDYHIYLFRESTNSLYQYATLSITAPQGGRPSATLVTRNEYESPVDGDGIFIRTYHGKPMLSLMDDCVYIAMSDERDELFGLLHFHYTPFRFAAMYYRSGFWLRSNPGNHRPQLQKVIITARALEESELPYVKGLLKLDSKQLMLTQRQVDIFLEEFRDAPWMPDFLQNYYPMFENHKKTFYCFDEDEILSCSISDLPPMERLKVLLALKSIDPPNNQELHKFIRCEDPLDTHKLLK